MKGNCQDGGSPNDRACNLAKQEEKETKDLWKALKHHDMSHSHTLLSSFSDVAASYRVYILDDLLAEPQEICYDWLRNLLYISQRYRQGNTFAPIATSQEVHIFDISIADFIGTVDLAPYEAPYGLELNSNCSYIYANVTGGTIWIDPETRSMTSYAPSGRHSAARQSSNDFIAEIDLQTGRMRQRINVPESENPTDGRFVAFSAPAIRFASRRSSSGMPVIDVNNDPVIDAIRTKFNVRMLYVTSPNVMLV